jgi:hypothetical protein
MIIAYLLIESSIWPGYFQGCTGAAGAKDLLSAGADIESSRRREPHPGL